MRDLKKLLTAEPVLSFMTWKNSLKSHQMLRRVDLELFLCRSMMSGNRLLMLNAAMTDAETRYAQIEKELFSITYACERFHQVVSGQAASVETDHKPLIALFQKPLNDCSLRIKKMMIQMQRYTFNLMYTPGKLVYTADTLSRAVDPKEPANIKLDDDVKVYVDMITSALPVADVKMQLKV